MKYNYRYVVLGFQILSFDYSSQGAYSSCGIRYLRESIPFQHCTTAVSPITFPKLYLFNINIHLVKWIYQILLDITDYALRIHRTLYVAITIYVDTMYLIAKAIPVYLCVSYFIITNIESKVANSVINFRIFFQVYLFCSK